MCTDGLAGISSRTSLSRKRGWLTSRRERPAPARGERDRPAETPTGRAPPEEVPDPSVRYATEPSILARPSVRAADIADRLVGRRRGVVALDDVAVRGGLGVDADDDAGDSALDGVARE